MIALTQTLLFVFAVYVFFRTTSALIKRQMSIKEFIFWSAIWITVIAVALNPRLIGNISRRLGISKGVDFLPYYGMIILFYSLYGLYIRVDNLEKALTKIVREIALKNKGKQK